MAEAIFILLLVLIFLTAQNAPEELRRHYGPNDAGWKDIKTRDGERPYGPREDE
jgi:hypothetical protein